MNVPLSFSATAPDQKSWLSKKVLPAINKALPVANRILPVAATFIPGLQPAVAIVGAVSSLRR
jgi:hypothetical protein